MGAAGVETNAKVHRVWKIGLHDQNGRVALERLLL